MNDVPIATIHSRHQVLKDFFRGRNLAKNAQRPRCCWNFWKPMQTWMRDPLIPSGLRCYFEGCNMAKGCKRTKSLTVVVWCCLFMISLDCPDAWYNRILGSWTTGALGTAFVATGPGIAGNGYGNDYPKRFNCWPHTVRIWMLLLKSTKARLRKEVGGQFSSANQRSCCSYSLNWEFVTKSICLWNDVTWLHHESGTLCQAARLCAQVWGIRWREDFLQRQRRIVEQIIEETPLSFMAIRRDERWIDPSNEIQLIRSNW